MRQMLFILSLMFTLSLPVATRAEEVAQLEDPDTEVARRYFEEGRKYYGANDYDKALEAFQKAVIAKPLPKFYWNIGRCYDRLGKWSEAVTAYQNFVEALPNDSDVPEAKRRIAELKDRLAKINGQSPVSVPLIPTPPAPVSPAKPPPTPVAGPLPVARPPSLVPPLVAGGLAVALGATALGLYYSIDAPLAELNASCVRPCQDPTLGQLRDREIASYVVGASAGAAFAVAAALGVRYLVLKNKRGLPQAAILPLGNGLYVAGSF